MRQDRNQKAKRQSIDGLVNVVSGLGQAKAKRTHNNWEYDLLNNWPQLEAAYQSNWIARQIVDVRAQDMCREWRRIKSNDAEAIVAAENQLNARTKVQEAIQWARLYGGAGILMCTNQNLAKPLDLNKVKKGDLKRLIVFDRWEMGATTMNTYDVLAPNYLQPEFFVIQGGHQQIHYSHFAKFYGTKLPRRKQALTQGWGDSELRVCIEDVSDIVASKGGLAELLQEANIDVIMREGLAEDLASDQDSAIIDRYTLFSQMKSIINLALLDGDETLDRKTLNLSGVAPVFELFMVWLAGAAKMPITKLFGTSPQGFNATGDGELKNYNDDIRSDQTTLGDSLQTLDEVLVRSATGSFPDDYNYEWNPLNESNDVEVAQAELLRAQKNRIYLEDSVVQRSQVMRELQANEEYQYEEGEIDAIEELEDPTLFEDPDLTTVTTDPDSDPTTGTEPDNADPEQ